MLIDVMKKHFQILVWEPSASEPAKVRLVGPPYKPGDPNCRHLAVPINKQTNRVSPLVLRHVIEKFQIEVKDFLQSVQETVVAEMPLPSKKVHTGSEG